MIIDEENGWTEARFIAKRSFALKYVAGYVNLNVLFSIVSKKECRASSTEAIKIDQLYMMLYMRVDVFP